MPFHFVLPGFDWLVTDTSQTEHRVGEDIGFGIGNLNRFVTEQSRRSPRSFFIINRGQTTAFLSDP